MILITFKKNHTPRLWIRLSNITIVKDVYLYTFGICLWILLSILQKLLAPYSHGENTSALVNWRKCKKLR